MWPVLASFCTFSFKYTAVQPFWLQNDLNKSLLGVWLGLFEAARLVTASCAPSPNASLVVTVVATVSLGLASAFIVNSPGVGAWLMVATGAFDPSAAMMCRLRAENLAHKKFDNYAELAQTSYVVGMLISTGMDALAALVGNYAIIASLAFVASCNAVIAALLFSRKNIGRELLSALKTARASFGSPSESDNATGEVEILCLSPRSRFAARAISRVAANSKQAEPNDNHAVFLRRRPSSVDSFSSQSLAPATVVGPQLPQSIPAVRFFDRQMSTSNRASPGLLKKMASIEEVEPGDPPAVVEGSGDTLDVEQLDIVNRESVHIENEDVAINGKGMLRLCVWMMTGVGAADSIVGSLGPILFADHLGVSPRVFFATALSRVSATMAFGPLCKRWGITYTPKNAVVLLTWAGFLCAVLAILPSNLPLAIVVYVSVNPCYDFIPRIVNRVVQSYARGKAIFDRYIVYARLGYQIGKIVASIVVTIVYFAAGPSIAYIGGLGISVLVAATSAWVFITDAVRLGAAQYLQLLELEAIIEASAGTAADGTPAQIDATTVDSVMSYVDFVRAVSTHTVSRFSSSSATPRSSEVTSTTRSSL